MRKKVTVIGAGNVGASLTCYLAESNLADIVLLDIIEGVPQGKALDLLQAGPIRGYEVNVLGTNDYKDIAGSDIVAISAGLARQPGMTREDLINKNATIVGQVTENVVKYAPNAFIIVVTNPLDIMTYHAFKKSGFPANRVMGQAGVLDSIRFRTFVALELKVSVREVQAMVLGGHGDSMVPLPRYTTVGGVPITELLSPERIQALSQRTRDGGTEIVKLLKTGSAFYAPAAAAAEMIDAILNDRKKMLAASALVKGEYGLSDLYIGVPVILGAGGVEEVVELKLQPEEKEALYNSAKIYKDMLKVLGY
ncbi:MAG: malate dehydrogenase [candidate division Zixibacteria bacterium RBG_16_48_11]|nr:MAG: malate dehydrogenase [candidate division Zixibacteria bacterium RBG_16_48_11]